MDRKQVRYLIFPCPRCKGRGYTTKLKLFRFDERYMPCEECQPDAYRRVLNNKGEYELREDEIEMFLDELVQYCYCTRPCDHFPDRYDIFDREKEVLVNEAPLELYVARYRCRVLNMEYTRHHPVG